MSLLTIPPFSPLPREDALNEHNSIADELGALFLLLTSRANERVTASCKGHTVIALMERYVAPDW